MVQKSSEVVTLHLQFQYCVLKSLNILYDVERITLERVFAAMVKVFRFLPSTDVNWVLFQQRCTVYDRKTIRCSELDVGLWTLGPVLQKS